MMAPDHENVNEDLTRIQANIVKQRRRLKKTAKKSQALSSDTDFLLKKVAKPDPDPGAQR